MPREDLPVDPPACRVERSCASGGGG